MRMCQLKVVLLFDRCDYVIWEIFVFCYFLLLICFNMCYPATINYNYNKFQLLSLQVSAEKYFFNIRKSLVEFDEVLEVHIL